MNAPDHSVRRDDAAYLGSVSVENLLCFGLRQTLDLTLEDGQPARWTIVLGDNGIGKTTLLQAAGGFAHRSAPRAGDNGAINSYWGSDDRLIRMQRHSAHKVNLQAEFLIGARFDEGANRYRSQRIGVQGFDHSTGYAYGQLQQYPPDLRALSCFGYGAARRAGSHVNLGASPEDFGAASLFSDAAELINPVEWLLQTDYAASKAESAEGRDFWNWRLFQVKQTLIELLPDVSDIRVAGPVAATAQAKPAALFATPYGEVPFERMGLGYRTMVAWIVDLAARMFQRWPDSQNPISEPAVVLVDEIDLHLHPTWQRRLLGWLSERFVNTQFIASAHSPLVVQAATDAKVALLRREGNQVVIDQSQQAVTGWRVDQILTSDLFGLPSARPARYDEVIAERTRLLSKRQLDAADEQRLQRLDLKMAEMPTGETGDDIEARDIIRRAAEALQAKTGQ